MHPVQITTEPTPSEPAAPASLELLRVVAEHRISLREVQDRYIDEVLSLTAGNKVRAAQILGIDRKTLYRRAERRLRRIRGRQRH